MLLLFLHREGGGGDTLKDKDLRDTPPTAECEVCLWKNEKREKLAETKKRKNASVAPAMTRNLPSLQREAVRSVLARTFKS